MSSSPNKVSQPRRKGRPGRTRLIALASTVVLILGLGVVLTQASKTNLTAGQMKAFNSSSQHRGKTYVGTKDIIVDKQTGKARKPTADETRELVVTLSTLTNRSSDGLSVVARPDGIKQVDLDGRFNGVTLARPGADGSMEVRCVTSFDEGADFLGLEEITQ